MCWSYEFHIKAKYHKLCFVFIQQQNLLWLQQPYIYSPNTCSVWNVRWSDDEKVGLDV